MALLRDAYVAGRLDVGELRGRAAAAYTAKTWGDLRELTADLPRGPVLVRWQEQLEVTAYGRPKRLDREGRRLSASMGLMGLAWLAIAAAAGFPVAAIPLIVLALFGLWAACGKPGR